MARMIKVRTLGKGMVEEVDLLEAEKILKRVYNDPIGGFAVDAKTREIIWQIGPDVNEIIILEHWLGGGSI